MKKGKPTYILGINEAQCASAALLIDGRILVAAQEERFTRIKNNWGFPQRAISFCCDFAKISPAALDLVVLSYKDPYTHFTSGRRAATRANFWPTYLKFLGATAPTLEYLVPSLNTFFDTGRNIYYRLYEPKNQKMQSQEIARALHLPEQKIIRMDHHLAHAYTAYYSNPDRSDKETLVLTCDGAGDQACAGVYRVKNNGWKLVAKTPHRYSLGLFYASITGYLGMLPHEDEYKVMGLAPYAGEGSYQTEYEILKKLIWVDGLAFQSRVPSRQFAQYLKDRLVYLRFDRIAAAAQKLTEELLVQWVTNAIEQTSIQSVVFGGGVFLNVKANKAILSIKTLKKAFFMPSSSDDTNAFGAAYYGCEQASGDMCTGAGIFPLTTLYLGSEYTDAAIEAACKKYPQFSIKKYPDITAPIAELLAEGKIVARFSGRMEMGARALGNRSILAHPGKIESIENINRMIKMRDFWMPFAATILYEEQHKYIRNPQNISSPFMALAFDTTPEGKKSLVAAVHPADKTTRPQILRQEDNPNYYEIIKTFASLTGIGAVLNTSFNIHGEPIVCTPEDALSTLQRSGLQYLALENYLISKPK